MRTVICAAALAVLGLAADLGHAQTAPATGGSSVTFMTAMAKAQALVPGGYLIQGRVERRGSVFGFYFMVNNTIREVEISGPTGKVIKDKTVKKIVGGAGVEEPGNTNTSDSPLDPTLVDAINARKKAKLPYNRLLEVAMKEVKGGELSRIEAVVEGGKLVVYVDLKVDGKVKRVVIDAGNNSVIKVEDPNAVG
jgi:uncharacterized membrane protein YkoI